MVKCKIPICFQKLTRSYDLARLVNQYKSRDLLAADVEGGATGAFGFAGLPFHLVRSTFLFYRAVQTIAMFYGYDVKNDTSECIIASEVFVGALSPQKSSSSEIGSLIGRIMLISELTAVKQTSVSTVLFDDQTEVLHDRVKLGEVRPITEKEYYVRGCTSLLDAIGGAIHHIGNIHKCARPEDVPEHTLFIITTDGMENASR